jgi:hypothetical protein
MARGKGRRPKTTQELMIEYWERKESGGDPSSGFSSTGNSAADDVSNRSGGDYHQRDAAIETGASSSEASAAWHTARDDNEEVEGLGDRHDGGWKY